MKLAAGGPPHNVSQVKWLLMVSHFLVGPVARKTRKAMLSRRWARNPTRSECYRSHDGAVREIRGYDQVIPFSLLSDRCFPKLYGYAALRCQHFPSSFTLFMLCDQYLTGNSVSIIGRGLNEYGSPGGGDWRLEKVRGVVEVPGISTLKGSALSQCGRVWTVFARYPARRKAGPIRQSLRLSRPFFPLSPLASRP